MRSVLITKDGVSVNSYEWDGESTVRLSWDVPESTVIELTTNAIDPALRVSVADLKAWMRQRDVDVATRLARQRVEYEQL